MPFRAAHEAAIHAAKLRVELSQSRSEQQEYLKNVELARVLDKRAEKKRERGEEFQPKPLKERPKKRIIEGESSARKKSKLSDGKLDTLLGNIF
jgi:ESF2/ABP1 family protein